MRILKRVFLLSYAFVSVLLILQLQGCAAAAVSGAATGVAMAHDRRSAGTMVDDQTIQIKALNQLSQNKELWKGSHITPVSYNNNLVLLGQTPTEEFRQQAEQAVNGILKIRKVYNELSVGEPTSIGTRTQDSWITTQVKTKMLGAKNLNPLHVKVMTEEGVVYLMGLTSPEEQMAATDIARNVSGVEKVVQIFEES